MNFRLTLIFVVFILLLSCKKKNIPSSSVPVIEIGNPKGMEIKTFNDTVTWFTQFPTPHLNYQDFNNDGEDDIIFNVWRSGSPGSGYAPMINLYSSDKINFMGGPAEDSSFQHLDTAKYFVLPDFFIYFRSRFNFTRIDSADKGYLNHYPFKISSLKPMDKLRQTDNFGVSVMNLEERNPDHIYRIKQSGDTTFYALENMNVNIHPYPMHEEIYFGFRYNENGNSKLGWVRFEIINEWAVKIIEIAIQKN